MQGAGYMAAEQDAFESGRGWARSGEMTDKTQPAPSSAAPEAAILAGLGKRLIVLVGMMGAGKSTVGRRLAGRLGLRFVDADTEIETAASMTIPEIFESRGEDYFRNGEARVIARLLDGGRRCWPPAAAPSCARRPGVASRRRPSRCG
jgi:hypothetical protein